MNQGVSEKPPFSYLVKVAQISHHPTELHLKADAQQLEALASFWRVSSIEELSADLKIRRWKKDGVKILGEVRAKVTQACVVTLDPVPAEIVEEIDQTFVPEGSALARIPANDQGEMIIDPDGPDLPDVFSGDSIDVGALAAEFAAMGLEPYPRKPDVEFDSYLEDTGEPEKKPSPFAVLKTLKIDK